MVLLVYESTFLSGDTAHLSWGELAVTEGNLLLKMAMVISSNRNYFA